MQDKPIAYWLFSLCFLLYLMIILGGVTRLTGSGLSMVHWQPIMGVIPPLTDAQWETTFAAYQTSPEYKKINTTMNVQGFKQIFVFEYAHRMLGRLLAFVFLIPFIIFLFLRKIPVSQLPKIFIMFILGGLQGLLGWYMVKSGLVDNPEVSQYRLVAHLMAALLIYGYIFWLALGYYRDRLGSVANPLRWTAYLVTGFVVLTIISGGFVAGLKAGKILNTFPLMNGQIIPYDLIYTMTPFWLSAFEEQATVQFNHRLLALTVCFLILFLVFRAVHQSQVKKLAGLILFCLIIQVSLGISTLILGVPVALASIHQGVAIILFSILLVLCHRLTYTVNTK